MLACYPSAILLSLLSLLLHVIPLFHVEALRQPFSPTTSDCLRLLFFHLRNPWHLFQIWQLQAGATIN